MRRKSGWWVVVAVPLGLFAFMGSSRAATPRPLAADVAWDADGVPRISLDGSALADAELRARIARGEPLTLALHVASEDAAAVRTCGVVHDAWQRRWEVTCDGGTMLTSDVDAVVRACLAIDDARVGDPSAWVGRAREDATFTVEVVLNPLTPRSARRLSRWLARSDGGEHTLFGGLAGRVALATAAPERSLGVRALHTEGSR